MPPLSAAYGLDIVLVKLECRGPRLLGVDPPTGQVKWRVKLPPGTGVTAILARRRTGRAFVIADGQGPNGQWRSRLYIISIARQHHRGGNRRRSTRGVEQRHLSHHRRPL